MLSYAAIRYAAAALLSAMLDTLLLTLMALMPLLMPPLSCRFIDAISCAISLRARRQIDAATYVTLLTLFRHAILLLTFHMLPPFCAMPYDVYASVRHTRAVNVTRYHADANISCRVITRHNAIAV